MSEQLHRPIAGTRPVVGDDFEPTLPRFRENPAIATRDAARGRVTHTEQSRNARIDKAARDLARADQGEVEGRVPGASWEQVSTVNAVVADEARTRAPARAAAVGAVDSTAREVGDRENDLGNSETILAVAEGAVPPRPWSGLALTQQWVVLLPLPVLIVLEVLFSKSSLLVALPDTGDTWTTLAAGGIAMVLTLGAELIALFLGTHLAGFGKRGAWISTAAVALVFVALIGWTVQSMASSREPNIAYEQSLKPTVAPGGSFGVGATSSSASGFNSTPAPTAPSATDAPSGPRLDFVVPVTLLTLFVGLALSLRCGIARPRKEAEARRLDALAGRDEAASALGSARGATEQAVSGLDRVDLDFAGLVATELATTVRILDRLQTEYEFACAVGGQVGRTLLRPAMPTAGELITQSFDPFRATARRQSIEGEPVAPRDPAPSAALEEPTPAEEPVAAEEPAAVPLEHDHWAAPGEANVPDVDPPEDELPLGWTWSGPALDLDDFPDATDGHIPPVPSGV